MPLCSELGTAVFMLSEADLRTAIFAALVNQQPQQLSHKFWTKNMLVSF